MANVKTKDLFGVLSFMKEELKATDTKNVFPQHSVSVSPGAVLAKDENRLSVIKFRVFCSEENDALAKSLATSIRNRLSSLDILESSAPLKRIDMLDDVAPDKTHFKYSYVLSATIKLDRKKDVQSKIKEKLLDDGTTTS